MNILPSSKRVTMLAGMGSLPFVPIIVIAGLGSALAAQTTTTFDSSSMSGDPMQVLLNFASAGGPWALMAALVYAVRYMTRRTEDTSKLLVDVLTTTVKASNEAIIRAQESSNQTHIALRDVLTALSLVSSNSQQMQQLFTENQRALTDFREQLGRVYSNCAARGVPFNPQMHPRGNHGELREGIDTTDRVQ